MFYYYCLFLVVTFCSCKQGEGPSATTLETTTAKEDSITLRVKVPANTSASLMAWSSPYESYPLKFTNKSDEAATIVRKIPLIGDAQVLTQVIFKTIRLSYMVSKKGNLEYNLEYHDNDLVNRSTEQQTALLDSLLYQYWWHNVVIHRSSNPDDPSHKVRLEEIYQGNKPYIEHDSTLIQLNDMHYLAIYQRLYPNNEKVFNYINTMDKIVIGSSFINLLSGHFQDRFNHGDLEKLNMDNYSDRYINYLAMGAFHFLKRKEIKQNKKYQPAVEWLKGTELYKKDSINILPKITALSPELFTQKLSNIKLRDPYGNKVSMYDIMTDNPASYYLIDFWATWCGPCIYQMNQIKQMNIPRGVKILSISVDKHEDLDEWKEKTMEMGLKASYWKDARLDENIDFTEFLKLKRIPRYVLIDKNMKLIDHSFYQPHEPQFLEKLRDVKNHLY